MSSSHVDDERFHVLRLRQLASRGKWEDVRDTSGRGMEWSVTTGHVQPRLGVIAAG